MVSTGRSTIHAHENPSRGFKVWVRADSVNGYFCTFEVYVGRPSDGTTEVGFRECVILQLSENLLKPRKHESGSSVLDYIHQCCSMTNP